MYIERSHIHNRGDNMLVKDKHVHRSSNVHMEGSNIHTKGSNLHSKGRNMLVKDKHVHRSSNVHTEGSNIHTKGSNLHSKGSNSSKTNMDAGAVTCTITAAAYTPKAVTCIPKVETH